MYILSLISTVGGDSVETFYSWLCKNLAYKIIFLFFFIIVFSPVLYIIILLIFNKSNLCKKDLIVQ